MTVCISRVATPGPSEIILPASWCPRPRTEHPFTSRSLSPSRIPLVTASPTVCVQCVWREDTNWQYSTHTGHLACGIWISPLVIYFCQCKYKRSSTPTIVCKQTNTSGRISNNYQCDDTYIHTHLHTPAMMGGDVPPSSSPNPSVPFRSVTVTSWALSNRLDRRTEFILPRASQVASPSSREERQSLSQLSAEITEHRLRELDVCERLLVLREECCGRRDSLTPVHHLNIHYSCKN